MPSNHTSGPAIRPAGDNLIGFTVLCNRSSRSDAARNVQLHHTAALVPRSSPATGCSTGPVAVHPAEFSSSIHKASVSDSMQKGASGTGNFTCKLRMAPDSIAAAVAGRRQQLKPQQEYRHRAAEKLSCCRALRRTPSKQVLSQHSCPLLGR